MRKTNIRHIQKIDKSKNFDHESDFYKDPLFLKLTRSHKLIEKRSVGMNVSLKLTWIFSVNPRPH